MITLNHSLNFRKIGLIAKTYQVASPGWINSVLTTLSIAITDPVVRYWMRWLKKCQGYFNKIENPVALVIDELGFRKKGKIYVCVSRQYPRCTGKLDNGQVAVAAALSETKISP